MLTSGYQGNCRGVQVCETGRSTVNTAWFWKCLCLPVEGGVEVEVAAQQTLVVVCFLLRHSERCHRRPLSCYTNRSSRDVAEKLAGNSSCTISPNIPGQSVSSSSQQQQFGDHGTRGASGSSSPAHSQSVCGFWRQFHRGCTRNDSGRFQGRGQRPASGKPHPRAATGGRHWI